MQRAKHDATLRMPRKHIEHVGGRCVKECKAVTGNAKMQRGSLQSTALQEKWGGAIQENLRKGCETEAQTDAIVHEGRVQRKKPQRRGNRARHRSQAQETKTGSDSN